MACCRVSILKGRTLTFVVATIVTSAPAAATAATGAIVGTAVTACPVGQESIAGGVDGEVPFRSSTCE